MKRSIVYPLAALAAGVWLARRAAERRYSFDGKVCLITGGSRGLGLVLARQICAAGGKVALLARNADELARAKQDIESRGGEALTVVCDLQQPEQIESVIARVVEHFGRLDVVINDAGIIEVGPFEHMSRADYERAMNVHFWALYHVTMAALPHLRRRGEARIVNVTSIGGKIAVPHLAPYCASKFAAVGLSEALGAELARERIYITTVAPGTMRTGSHVNANFKGRHAAEYSWFAAAAGVPLLSMKAERAAAKILAACRRGQPFLAVPIYTKLAIAADALFPNIVARVLGLTNRLLPGASDASGDQLRSGWQSRRESPLPSWVTHFGDRASEQNNEANGAR